MTRISEAVIKHRKFIIPLAILLSLVSVFAMLAVKVNYNLSDYLPKDAPTSQAMRAIKTELPNLQLYLPGLNLQQARAEKEALKKQPGVSSVLWLDDVLDLQGIPEAMIDPALLAQYFKDGPLYQLTIKEDLQPEVVPSLRAAYPGALLKGPAADSAQQANVTMGQVSGILYYVLPFCLLVLLLATRHWVEPLLFLIAIGIAILFNEGTNIIFGSISFITRACSAVLQLAVSIDYAIFLLHRFSEFRDQGMEPALAMRQAMRKASGTIAASALTTVFGFLALLLMNFRLGRDMGLVLAKGVLMSYLSVMVFLPALATSCVKWIDKTRHRSFMLSFKRTSKMVVRFGAPLALVLLLSLPLAFLMQHKNTFIYGSDGMHSPDSPLRQESGAIEEIFGTDRLMLLLVPEGDRAKEVQLSQSLHELPGIKQVISYVDTVSAEIPPQVLAAPVRAQFYADGYARFILTTAQPAESPGAFSQVEQIRKTAATIYPKGNHLLGEAAVNLDLKTFITADNLKVLLAGILSVGLVLLINFKNLTIPLVLLIIIQGSIWHNMAAPYLAGLPLNYIGFQIVSSVQLGATVDYGILLSQRYLEGRQTKPPKEAAAWALEVSAGSILPPVMILMIAGFALGILVRENGVISEMGIIIGRGAALSCIMVLLVLPKVLHWSDRLIMKTQLGKRKKRT